MEIKDILDSLGLDFSNPETKRGALEALEAILDSRAPNPGGGFGGGVSGGEEIDIELDPDLIQPSIKQTSTGPEDDIEIEDEESILDQIKHNKSENDSENNTSDKDSSKSPEDAESGSGTSDAESASGGGGDTESDSKGLDKSNKNDSNEKDSSDGEDEDIGSEQDSETDFDGEDVESGDIDGDSGDSEGDLETDDEDADGDGDLNTDAASEGEGDSDKDEDAEYEFDEDDLLDDELAKSLQDQEQTTKVNSRKIKRDRTLAAAKKALENAKAKKAAPALIRELEKAIDALEALTEAVTKNIKDMSDEEFNLIINRVFDAIDAIGDSGLTYSSQEDRELRAKEIKDDLSKAETQNELSAEDVAKIRAEHQATKAREREADKYKTRSRNSFKGFQDFLASLYRAIALQVSTEETRDDTWSAISRRNSGAGVLRQGQRVNDLPNKKIPVIDFYFDQSSSWSADDIKVGQKAVEQLADMEAKGQIKMNIYYFSDEVFTSVNDPRTQRSTKAWNDIVRNIITTQATNVIIMTDSDMEYQYKGSPLSYTVPGYVWYLWKDGLNAPRLPRDLKGRGGTQQFSFSSNDI